MISKILNLVNSVEFQELNSYYNEKTMFNALNVERNENRHSAFIAWWLNPKSEHGLGDAPLKLFLRLVAAKGWDIAALYNRVLAGNYNISLLEDIQVEKSVGKIGNSNSKDRMDIWAALELSYEEDGDEVRKIVPVIIENKIYNREGKEQTMRYYNAALDYRQEDSVESIPMGVLLTVEDTNPTCNVFVNVTYQELLTYVIEPLASSVAPDSLKFVESFIRNLGRPALTDNKYYGVLAVSKKERGMLERVVENNKEVFNTAFDSLYSTKKIVDQEYLMADISENDKDILHLLWDANEVVFKAVLYHLYGKEHKKELDKLFKSSNRDTSKYVVKYKDEELFGGKRLSKAMTACAIFQAYLKEYPTTTLEELQKAFPCEKLNDYYYNRFFNDLFYEYQRDFVDEEGFELVTRTCGKDNGLSIRAFWDFYLKDELLLPIENGAKRAMCVKMWRKGDFDKLYDFVAKNYPFIEIEER